MPPFPPRLLSSASHALRTAWPALLIGGLAACAPSPLPSNTPQPTPAIFPTEQRPEATRTTPTIEPLPSPSPSPTATPTPLLMADFGPGAVEIPILLYHHISPTGGGTRYTLRADAFEAQLDYLARNGYQTVTVSQVAGAIRDGARLPARPVVLTFDDGNLDTYTEAFPRLRSRGFIGVVYVVANRLGAPGFLSASQLQEMAAAGWEIGSHSRTHADLTSLDRSLWRQEILGSRLELQSALGLPVETFAYPFGLGDAAIFGKTSEYGYRSAVGLGKGTVHDRGELYYLQRREVLGGWDLAAYQQALEPDG